MRMATCLFVGKFQPFHNGHLMVLKGMVKLCDRVVVVIGSADAKRTKEDPFSAEERKDMIQRALQEENLIPNCNIDLVTVADEDSDTQWARACLLAAGNGVGVVWTGREKVKEAFESIGTEVKMIKEVPGISSDDLRRKMVIGDLSWKDQVPSAVVDCIREIDGVERLKS